MTADVSPKEEIVRVTLAVDKHGEAYDAASGLLAQFKAGLYYTDGGYAGGYSYSGSVNIPSTSSSELEEEIGTFNGAHQSQIHISRSVLKKVTISSPTPLCGVTDTLLDGWQPDEATDLSVRGLIDETLIPRLKSAIQTLNAQAEREPGLLLNLDIA